VTSELPTNGRNGVSQEMSRILRPDIHSSLHGIDGGYVDTLGERDALGPHVGQRAFHSKVLALIYERIWRPGTARLFFGARMRESRERRVLLDMLRLTSEERVVDVGCGPGNYTRPLAKIVHDGLVVGVDASVPMLSRAVRKGDDPNLVYVRGDAGALPFVDRSFDAACCVGVLHVIENPMAALDEMTRVLSPGGRLSILTTCGKERSKRSRGGIVIFRRGDVTRALAERGFVDVRQRVVRRGQFVAGSLPSS